MDGFGPSAAAVVRPLLIWGVVGGVFATALGLAAASPLLAWRDATYIAAGFAGVFALVATCLQPLLAGGYLPGARARFGRRVHVWSGGTLVAAVLIHVGGLWITSPPDVIDALTFTSPTPFSAWGVVAMWAVFASAGLALFRRRWRVSPRVWRLAHTGLACVIAVGGVVHALLIDGTMDVFSKVALCALTLAATAKVVVDLRAWRVLRPRRT